MTMQNSEAEMATELTTLPLVTYTRTQPPAARQQTHGEELSLSG